MFKIGYFQFRPHFGMVQKNLERILSALTDVQADHNAAKNYQGLLNSLETLHISTDDAALLIIDPQRSFTKGAWMRSIGTEAEVDIKPIELAFDKCAELLKKYYGRIDIMFTRCPFPPDSYDWDD